MKKISGKWPTPKREGWALLDPTEIEALYRDTESDRVERKAAYASKRDEIRQAICAFANDLPDRRRPGVVFVGQNDDGSCAGVFDEVNHETIWKNVAAYRNPIGATFERFEGIRRHVPHPEAPRRSTGSR